MATAASRSAEYNGLLEFLTTHGAKDKKDECTHTRMKDMDLGIYPGSYSIPQEELGTFFKLYYDHVFVKKRKEYLTEKQLSDGQGPIVVDFDFRYDYAVDKRLHTKDDIVNMVLNYLEELKSFFVFNEEVMFDLFVFEKPNVNRLADKTLTKDGIHMLIGLQMDHVMQTMLRERMLTKMSEIWDLPLTNTWDKVLDDGISKGCTNWQLYGSRKPGCEAYELTYHYQVAYDSSDGEFMVNEAKVVNFDLKKNLCKLSVQYKGNPRFEINPAIVGEYENRKRGSTSKPRRVNSRAKMTLLSDLGDEENTVFENQPISLQDITNHEMLHRAMENILNSLEPSEYFVRETHLFTQILPEKYYEPGSHALNRQVAFALKHTDERLFLSWVMLRSKASDFDFATIPDLYNDWKRYFNVAKEGVTKRSILFWAKQDAFEDYIKVKNETIDHFILKSCESNNDYGVALVLKQMYKDKYICVSLTKGDAWFVFKNHRWQTDKGLTLRNAISEEMYNIFCKKRESLIGGYTGPLMPPPPTDGKKDGSNTVASTMMITMNRLRNTADKNKFMREAAELFFDEDFIQKMDTNKYLLGFNNGVVDFKNKIFREGYPTDYITKTTNINYHPLNKSDPHMMQIRDEIIDFMEKLFPIPEQNQYMWDHLASVLIGVNRTQTFNIYHGSGSNGKSKLVDLMTLALGEYKAIVPVNLLTDKRVSIGGTSDEILKLKGVRYAVGQELSKGAKLNEGIMKELSGGDEIQARGLYSESEKFSPQFKLVICTNNLFDIESNDDGTWRRIRRVVYYSKFARPEEMETFADLPYLYPMDPTIEDKLPIWAPVFMAMLVERAFITEGMVQDCPLVLRDSQSYRKGQDHIAAFVNEKVRKTGDVKHFIKKDELKFEFQKWYQMEQGDKKPPKPAELNEYMSKKFTFVEKKGWRGVQLIYPDASEESDHEN